MAKIAILGSGFISSFYVESLKRFQKDSQFIIVQSRSKENAHKFAEKYTFQSFTDNMREAISHPDVDLVIIGLPNHQHLEAVLLCAEYQKEVMCTKPLGRNAKEAKMMLEAVERSGIFHGYLEDLVYTPKSLKSVAAIKNGSIGKVLWARARETHPGPHSDWFWNIEKAGGGAIVDLACHCIELARNYIGKDVKPIEVMCWADTLVKPIAAEDNAIGLVKYQNGAIGQFEVSWSFRGGMDLRDEVSGTEGTIWINHFLRTGFEMYTSGNQAGYVGEKVETNSGWQFPVGDECVALGYVDMFEDMFDCLVSKKEPMESFYDGYVVNAIMDACYISAKSKKWEPVILNDWRGSETSEGFMNLRDFDEDHLLVKEEILPDGSTKHILKHKVSGEIKQIHTSA